MGDYEADAPRSSGSEQPNRGPDSERLLALLESAGPVSAHHLGEAGAARDGNGLILYFTSEANALAFLDALAEATRSAP